MRKGLDCPYLVPLVEQLKLLELGRSYRRWARGAGIYEGFVWWNKFSSCKGSAVTLSSYPSICDQTSPKCEIQLKSAVDEQ